MSPIKKKARLVAVLAKNGWFSRRPPDLQQQLIEHAQIAVVEAGHWLYDKGDEARGLYGVLTGSVTSYVTLETGDDVPISISGPGSIFGYAAQVLGGYRVTTTVAREHSEIIFIPQHALATIAHELPSLWLHFAELATEQLTWAARTIAEQTRLKPKALIAARLHSYSHAWPPRDNRIVLPIRQDELAEMTGLSRKTVNRILIDLERQGLITLGYREIEVRRPKALLQIVMDGSET